MKHWKRFREAINEDDVKFAYRPNFEAGGFVYKNIPKVKNDSFFSKSDIKVLCEYKSKARFRENTFNMARAFAQTIYYLKDIDATTPSDFPNVIFIADENDCAILPASFLSSYMNGDYDWNRPASSPDRLLALDIQEKMDPSLIEIWEGMEFSEVIDEIQNAYDGKSIKQVITPENVDKWFSIWDTKIIVDKKLTPHERVEAFYSALFDPDNTYKHPKKLNRLVFPGKEVKINGSEFDRFKNRVKTFYSKKEIKRFHSHQDILILESVRRFRGEFYTPTIWVNEAHRYLTRTLGDDWYEECLVIDPAAGTANLTRDYEFSNLILSTLEQEDVDIIRRYGYNKGAIIEKWDFLNEDVPASIDAKLKWAAENNVRVVWLMNPPFGTANDLLNKHKAGIADTMVRKDMARNLLKLESQQLYVQFLFNIARICERYKIEEYTVGTYSLPVFMTGSYQKFRDFWYRKCEFKKGFMFPGGEFEGTKKNTWPITFTTWGEGNTKGDIPLDMKVNENGMKDIGRKELYTAYGREANKWIRSSVTKNMKVIDSPSQTSGLKFKSNRGNNREAQLGYIYSNANIIQYNQTFVSLYSQACASSNGTQIFPENFLRSCALFTARKTIQSNWINHKDEYLIPNTDHPEYKQWNNDAIVYSIFHGSNNCTAVRELDYKGEKWDIKNNFFWMPKEYMKQLAEEHDFILMLKDIEKDSTGEAYVSSILPMIELSPEAQEVLDIATELLTISMKDREHWHYENEKDYPELEPADIQAALTYAAELVAEEKAFSVEAA